MSNPRPLNAYMIWLTKLYLLLTIQGSAGTLRSDSVEASDSTSTFFPYPSSGFPLERVDTLKLQHFHEHRPDLDQHSLHLGNIGQDVNTLVHPVRHPQGLRHGLTLNPWQIDTNKTGYFQVPYPVTRLNYILGGNEEQFFRVRHTQNITPRFNAGVTFRKLISKGAYDRQETNSGNLSASTNYYGQNGRYLVRAHYIRNDHSMQLNGGITDSLLQNNTFSNRQNIPVRLKNALYNGKQTAFSVKQAYYVGKGQDPKKKGPPKEGPSFRVQHQTQYKDLEAFYQDKRPGSGFYDRILLDSSRTMDKRGFKKWTHKFGGHLMLPVDTSSFHKSSIGIRHERMKVYQPAHDPEKKQSVKRERFSSTFLQGDYNFISDPIDIDLRGWIGIRGTNKRDQGVRARISVPAGKAVIISAGAGISRSEPSYKERSFTSNHFFWRNDLSKERRTSGFIRLDQPRSDLHIEARGYKIHRPIFYGPDATPAQADNSAPELGMLRLKKDFVRGHWHLENDLVGQTTRAGRDIFRVPRFISRNTFYYEGWFFDKAMKARIGLVAFYYSSFMNKDYMPALRTFFLQNQQEVGDRPFFTPFIDARVNDLLFFLKMKHANAGLQGEPPLAFPGRPYPGRRLKFGVKWVLFN